MDEKRTRYVVPIKTVVETAGHLIVEADSPEEALDEAERYCEELGTPTTFGESTTVSVEFEGPDEDLPIAPEEATPDVVA